MKHLYWTAPLLLGCTTLSFAQTGSSVNYLTENEIATAIAGKPDSGFVYIEEGGFTTPSSCQAQMPSESIFTPEGWLNAQAQRAKGSYSKFTPTPEDTERVLTILSRGCANGTPSGPTCDSITRAVLLSDKAGTVTLEAISNRAIALTWQNGYGATNGCSSLVSRFSLKDLKKVRNAKGEFLIATFNGSTLLKIYTVKEKHLKKLGI